VAFESTTPTIEQTLSVAVPAVQRGSTASGPTQVSGVEAPTRRATSKDRDAILQQLYDMRAEITRAKRLGKSSAHDEERLADINAYINHWQTVEAPPEREDVWKRLEALVPELLSIRASIHRAR
jgi:hypothetical protein